MLSIWWCVFESGECHVVLLDLLFGYSVFAMVRFLLHANSKSRSLLSFVFPNLPTVPAQSSYAPLPIFVFQSPMIMVISFFPCSRDCLFECLVEHFSFFVAVRCCWGVNLYNSDVNRFRCDSYWYYSAFYWRTVDCAICDFLSYYKGYAMLVFFSLVHASPPH